MICLAIDTSSRSASVALLEDRNIIYAGFLNDGRTHSEKLMPMVEACFETSGRDIGDVDLFAVVNGPGSFTGVRIGVAAIKGMAHAGQKPIAAVNALDAMRYGAGSFDGIVCCLVDARNAQVYSGIYKGGELVRDYAASHNDEVLEFLQAQESMVLFAGCGADANREAIMHRLNQRAVFAQDVYPEAKYAGKLAFDYYEKGLLTDYLNLAPCYIRKSSAERNLGES